MLELKYLTTIPHQINNTNSSFTNPVHNASKCYIPYIIKLLKLPRNYSAEKPKTKAQNKLISMLLSITFTIHINFLILITFLSKKILGTTEVSIHYRSTVLINVVFILKMLSDALIFRIYIEL